MNKYLLLLISLAMLIACDDSDSTPTTTGGTEGGAGMVAGMTGATEGGAGMVAGMTGATEGGAGMTGGNMATDSQELFFLKVKLVDVGGIVTTFQAEIQKNSATPDKIAKFIFRAVKADMLSDDLVTVEDIAVAADGSFEVDITDMTLPGAFSPTGSDVKLDLKISAQAKEMGFCGMITGEVTTLMIPLTQSTFAAVPWASRSDSAPSSCDDNGPKQFDRIATCPTLNAGENTIASAGLMRKVKLVLPSTISNNEVQGETYPLVFLWHGFGGTADDIEGDAQLSRFVDEKKFILAVPSSDEAVAGVEWASLSYEDSEDLAFFDDMVKCISETYPVDSNRIHTTGLSAGGLWTAYLSVTRSQVLASAVGMSSGLIPGYPEQAPERKIPYIVAWGGPNDIAYDQNFDMLASSLTDMLLMNGHFVVDCNHNQEHKWLPEFSPWVLQFLLDHDKTVAEGTSPYAGTLTDVYPDYCQIMNQ
jgi:predicted esterase